MLTQTTIPVDAIGQLVGYLFLDEQQDFKAKMQQVSVEEKRSIASEHIFPQVELVKLWMASLEDDQ
jgi:hypothetical protein